MPRVQFSLGVWFRWILLAVLALLVRVRGEAPVEVAVDAAGDLIAQHVAMTTHDEASAYTRMDDTTVSTDDAVETTSVDRQVHSTLTSEQRIASFAVFQKELEAIEAGIQLQQQKIGALEKLRRSVLASSEPSEWQIDYQRRPAHDQSARDHLHEAIDRKLEILAADFVEMAAKTRFDTYFVERPTISRLDDVVDVKMSAISGLPSRDLIVMATRSGILRFYLSPVTLLLEYNTNHNELHLIQLELEADPPFLAATFQGKSPRVISYALNLTRDGRSLTQPDVLPPFGPTLVSPGQYLMSVAELGRFDLEVTRTPSALTIARTSRRGILGVSHRDGSLAFYSSNGTLLHEFQANASEATTLATHRNLLAFANGTSTVLVAMTRQREPDFHVCSGSLASVTSIVFDPVNPQIFYSGTSDGEILTYSFGVINGESSSLHCQLVHRVIIDRGVSLQLVVMKNYVISAGGGRISALSVSKQMQIGERQSLELICASARMVGRAFSMHAVLSLTENTHETRLAVLHVSEEGSAVFQQFLSLLSSPTTTVEGVKWNNFWYFGVAGAVVVIAQLYLRRKHDDSSEMEDWRALLDKHRALDASKRFPPARGFDNNGTFSANRLSDELYQRQAARASKVDAVDNQLDEDLRREIAQARRETLECSFDEDDDGF